MQHRCLADISVLVADHDRSDAFAAPEELVAETEAVAGPVTLKFVDGDHSLRRSEVEVAEIVAAWLSGL